MATPTPQTQPQVVPYLYYADAAAALEWLAKAFGFREMNRMAGADGKVAHAAMSLDDGGLIMLGCPGPNYRNPKNLGAKTQSLYIHVRDVDAHFARARKAGARILEEPKDQEYGQRRYGAEDPEGHAWYFAAAIG
jgi:uncharacterized glyoxalase superfamily protein PhnB